MAEEPEELFDAPETVSETIEYAQDLEDSPEIDPEGEQEPEPEDRESAIRRAEMEQEFARYERNYRARRIRDLTRAPVRKTSKRPGTRARGRG